MNGYSVASMRKTLYTNPTWPTMILRKGFCVTLYEISGKIGAKKSWEIGWFQLTDSL